MQSVIKKRHQASIRQAYVLADMMRSNAGLAEVQLKIWFDKISPMEIYFFISNNTLFTPTA